MGYGEPVESTVAAVWPLGPTTHGPCVPLTSGFSSRYIGKVSLRKRRPGVHPERRQPLCAAAPETESSFTIRLDEHALKVH